MRKKGGMVISHSIERFSDFINGNVSRPRPEITRFEVHSAKTALGDGKPMTAPRGGKSMNKCSIRR